MKNVTELGPQLSPGVTDVSRDGGYTVLINGHIVWIYDDTECFDQEGNQLSFVSNTAAYSDQPNKNVSTVVDFGVVDLGKDKKGKPKSAILAKSSVGSGGWVPFQPDELQFNKQKNGQERVAICRFVFSFGWISRANLFILERARNLTDINKYYTGFPLRTTSLCRQQTSRSIQGISGSGHDTYRDLCNRFRACCNSPRGLDHPGHRS